MAEPSTRPNIITRPNIESLSVYPLDEKYTLDETIDAGLTELFAKFTHGFERYVSEAAEVGQTVIDELNRTGSEINVGSDYIKNAGSFHRYKRFLQRACFAASRIAKNYDVGVGIARRGLWLSYIFNLFGLPTYDILVLRQYNKKAATPIYERATIPISMLTSDLIRGKRVLLFDNDIVTGDTISSVVNGISRASPNYVDLLLIYRDTRIFPNYYAQVQPKFRGNPQVLGRTSSGRLVIDTSSEVPQQIRRTMSLEYDFNREFRDARHGLEELARILQVSFVEPSPQFHSDILRQRKKENQQKVVSFDLDGTILDREFDYCLWGSHDYEGRGVLWQYIGKQLSISPKEAYEQGLSVIDNVPCGKVSLRAWISYFRLGNNEDEINAVEKEIVDEVCNQVNVRVNEDYKGLTKELRRKVGRIIICTESSGYMLEKKLESAGIKDEVNAIYSSVDLMNIRKGRRFYSRVLELEGISPKEMIHVGDSAKRDYHKPRALGIVAYYIDVNRELQYLNPSLNLSLDVSENIPTEHQLVDLRQILEELR